MNDKTKTYYLNDLYPAKFEKSSTNSRKTPTSSSSLELQYQKDEFSNEPIQIQGNNFVTYFHVTILTKYRFMYDEYTIYRVQ